MVAYRRSMDRVVGLLDKNDGITRLMFGQADDMRTLAASKAGMGGCSVLAGRLARHAVAQTFAALTGFAR
jgi:hypothetical protein